MAIIDTAQRKRKRIRIKIIKKKYLLVTQDIYIKIIVG
jgi:hypothetical protein